MFQSERRLSAARRLRFWGIVLVVVYVVARFMAFRASLDRIPPSWTVAGESFADRSIDDVVAGIQTAFDAPVILHYYDDARALIPDSVDFEFDAEATAASLRAAREQSATTTAFLRLLLLQQPDPRDLPIVAAYSDEKIRLRLSEMALTFDRPAQAPSPDLATITLRPGQAGYMLDIAASVQPVADALISIRSRDVDLIVDPQPAQIGRASCRERV